MFCFWFACVFAGHLQSFPDWDTFQDTCNGETMTARGEKPKKPYSDFPLFAHANGQWAKKIRGKLHFFGVWAEPDLALRRYLDERDSLHAGANPALAGIRRPHESAPIVTVGYVCNYWLTRCKRMKESGELSGRTFLDYRKTAQRVIAFFGRETAVDTLQPADFTAYRSTWPDWAVGSVRREITQTKIPFRLAHTDRIIPELPHFGTGFSVPTSKVIRRARQLKVQSVGASMFQPAEIQSMLQVASVPLRAMILLGVNCGFGNSDCARLPQSVVKGEWLEYPREKTAVERMAWLWPETREAVTEATRTRPDGKDDTTAGLVFLTRQRRPWVRLSEKGVPIDSIALQFGKLVRGLGLHRDGVGFYALRRTFETVAGETTDQVAVDCVMGHVDSSMAAVYRQHVGRERIKAVCVHVREWLFLLVVALLFFGVLFRMRRSWVSCHSRQQNRFSNGTILGRFQNSGCIRGTGVANWTVCC